MGIEDTQIKLLEEVVKYLEDDKVEKELKAIRNIAKKYFKSVQEIKALLARIDDEKSKQLLKQIIEVQAPEIEEITQKYIEDGYTAAALSVEYDIDQIEIKRLISEYAFITNREKQYNKRIKHKESTMYKPREKKLQKNQQINMIINPSIIQNESLIKEGEDR